MPGLDATGMVNRVPETTAQTMREGAHHPRGTVS
jgi:hypothetical protein